MSELQRYRMRNASTGRQLLIEADPDQIYVDEATGEPLEVLGKVLPLRPSTSKLPWAVENLRFCPHCDELSQNDLDDCPTCGRHIGPPEG